MTPLNDRNEIAERLRRAAAIRSIARATSVRAGGSADQDIGDLLVEAAEAIEDQEDQSETAIATYASEDRAVERNEEDSHEAA